MQIIINWLNGPRNFTVGKILYNTVGNKQAVKDLLEKGKTTFSEKLLVDELQKIITPPIIDEKVEIPVKKPLQTEAATPKEAEVMPDSFDEVLQSLKAKWVTPYQRMNYLRHKLDKEFDDIDSREAVSYRKSLVFEILKLEQECIQVWKERSYYVKHGTLPNFSSDKKIEIPTDPLELAALINSLKKNIRRNRKAMKDYPENPRYAELYIKYKASYKEITGKEYQEKE